MKKYLITCLTLILTFSFDLNAQTPTTLVIDLAEPAIGLLSIFRGITGMAFVIFVAWLFSTNRKAINWKVVGVGLTVQLVLAVGILFVPFVQDFFEMIGKMFVKILSFTEAGTAFLFQSMVTGKLESSLVNFAITILPTIIFFSALTSVLFYFGIIQKVVYFLAIVMTKLFRLSGSESLSVAGNIFLGQTESVK